VTVTGRTVTALLSTRPSIMMMMILVINILIQKMSELLNFIGHRQKVLLLLLLLLLSSSSSSSSSLGPCWARHLAQSLHNGEDYVLQIDSHMRFRPNWLLLLLLLILLLLLLLLLLLSLLLGTVI